MSVGRVVLEWDSFYATEYSIQVSNDQSNWTTVFGTAAGDGGRDEITFAATTARYVLLETTNWANGSWRNTLAEFEVYSGEGSQATPTPEPTPTPTSTPGPAQYIHIGNLETASFPEPRNRWTAQLTILVHNEAEQPVAGITINGVWGDGVSGSGSCITDSLGSCTIEKIKIKRNVSSVQFDINDLANSNYQYLPSANHNDNEESIEPFVAIIQP
jgi:hypothetical protein